MVSGSGAGRALSMVEATQHHFPGSLAELGLFSTPSLRQTVSSLGMGTKGLSPERGPCSSPRFGKAKGEFLPLVAGVLWHGFVPTSSRSRA